MVGKLNAWVRRRKALALAVACFALIGVVALVDDLTGYEVSFAIFYLLPVSVASWYVGRKLGVATAVVSAAVSLGLDLAAGNRFGHGAMAFWDAAVALGFFLITGYLLSALRARLDFEKDAARTDALTGVLNARGFCEQAAVVLGLAARHSHPFTMAYMDVDDLKKVNDLHGRSGGDRLLQMIADTLRQSVRASDIVARMGGDEFAVLFPETDYEGGGKVVAAVRDCLYRAVGNTEWPVTFSMGVVTYALSPATVDEVIRTADALMVGVKSAGKNGVAHELDIGEIVRGIQPGG